MNRKFFLMAGIAVLALTSAAILPVRADAPEQDEVGVTMAQLPAPVAQTLTREAAGGQIGEIDMEIGNHKATYEADVVINKIAYDVSIAMDGTLLAKNFDDMDLTLDQLPAPVMATVKQEMGDGTASDVAENYFDSGGSYYEATLQIGKHAYDMTVLPDGTLIKIELQKHEEENEDADQDHATMANTKTPTGSRVNTRMRTKIKAAKAIIVGMKTRTMIANKKGNTATTIDPQRVLTTKNTKRHEIEPRHFLPGL